jgi:uncharacterized membrane protein YebE (DUF533 family)
MMNLDGLSSFEPLWRAQLWAATHLLFMQDSSGDLRCDVIALAMRGLAALGAFAEKQLSAWAHHNMRRARQGADFAASITAAATMVAAGDR